jgi:hypothetical protein
MRVRRLVSDKNSAEVDQLRRTVNALLLVLENLSTTSFTTVTDLQEALANTLATGVDSDYTTPESSDSYVGTGVELVGVRPTPKHPVRPGMAAGTQLVVGDASDAE